MDTFSEEVSRIKSKLEKIGWFSGYQDIPELGIKGKRSKKRYKLMSMFGLRGKTVADFGSNIGQACFEFYRAGALDVYGFDLQQNVVDAANLISKHIGAGSFVRFHKVDFNDVTCFADMDMILPEQVDVSLFLSVYRTKELTQRDKLFSYIIGKTKEKIYFEGHADKQIDTIDYYNDLFSKFGLKGHFLGNSEVTIRPLFVIDL